MTNTNKPKRNPDWSNDPLGTFCQSVEDQVDALHESFEKKGGLQGIKDTMSDVVTTKKGLVAIGTAAIAGFLLGAPVAGAFAGASALFASRYVSRRPRPGAAKPSAPEGPRDM